MAVFLGLLVAASFGTGDFFGGLASRRAATATVLASVQVVALAGALAAALVFTAEDIRGDDIVLGCVAGAANVVGLGILFYGLAVGRMAIVAPVTAALGASVPVVWGLTAGERPGSVALVGVVLAVLAAVLIGTGPDHGEGRSSTRQSVLLAGAAGVALGTSFIAFAKVSDGAGFWPVVSARGVALGLAAGAVLVRRVPRLPPRPDRPMVAATGVLDVTANVLLLLALRRGLASLVAPVAALGPAATVGLAAVVLHERVERRQLLGLPLAVAGIALIASG